MRPVRVLVSVAVFAAFTGCNSGPTKPRLLEGVYTVFQANGAAVPTVILAHPSNDEIRLLDATVELRMPDTLVLTTRTQYVTASGSLSEPVTDSARARFTLNGTVLELRQLGSEPLAFESAGTITSDAEIHLTTVRPFPPSTGIGTYPVALRARK